MGVILLETLCHPTRLHQPSAMPESVDMGFPPGSPHNRIASNLTKGEPHYDYPAQISCPCVCKRISQHDHSSLYAVLINLTKPTSHHERPPDKYRCEDKPCSMQYKTLYVTLPRNPLIRRLPRPSTDHIVISQSALTTQHCTNKLGA